jgi:hypothetical protein
MEIFVPKSVVTLSANRTASCLSCVVANVPAPETYAMLLVGLALIGAIKRRRKAEPMEAFSGAVTHRQLTA